MTQDAVGCAADLVRERALIESEERLRGIIDSSSDFIFLLDRDCKFLSINKVGADIRGKSPQELIGTSAFEMFPEKTAAQFSENIKNVFDTGKSMLIDEKMFVNGCELYNSTSLNPVRDDKGRILAVAGIVRDITERKKTEEELRRERIKFEAMFKLNPEASVYLDDSFHILDINSRFSSLFGYSVDEVRGKKLDEIVVPPNLVEEGKTLDVKAAEGYVYHDTVRMRKDGSLISVSVSAAPISIQGCPVGFIGVYKDISGQKSAERKLAMMNEKLRVIGGLTRHDVRNKLSIITANAYLIKKRLQDRPEVAEGFKDMESACGMIIRIFDFARDYERLGVEELTYVDVEDCAQKAASLFSNIDGTTIDLECHGVTVFADSLLRQLFYNLIDNSLKYGEHVTRMKIRNEKSADQLKLIYEDNGVGISAQAKSSIFHEGFTTGKGSGYGLYFIKKMMEVYGWTINETGTSGKGVQFVMAIPRINNQGRENYRINE